MEKLTLTVVDENGNWVVPSDSPKTQQMEIPAVNVAHIRGAKPVLKRDIEGNLVETDKSFTPASWVTLMNGEKFLVLGAAKLP